MNRRHAAVELGGTRVAVVVGEGPGLCSDVVRLATSGPRQTLLSIAGALKGLNAQGWAFESVAVACFGPLELDPSSANYGRVLATPKPGWTGADVLGALAEELGVPVTIDTDVNAAAVGEGRWGACQGLGQHAYITAGTGVGAGLCVMGTPVHGLLHPESGHLRARRDLDLDPFPGVCRWHGDCFEGLASGSAIAERVGRDPASLEPDDPVWDLAGAYLGQLCAALAFIVSPQRIVLGGGVGRRPKVLGAARFSLAAELGGYLARPRAEDMESFLVGPELGADSGLFGALALAQYHGVQAKLSANAASPPL
ncbi:MAG TPA: ROK family protein [Caulobacteraceae bacterium]